MPDARDTALNKLLHAEFCKEPDWVRGVRTNYNTAAKQEGVRYERKAQKWLEENLFSVQRQQCYAASPWISYNDSGRRSWAQPDGILLDFKRKKITIIEIKLKHVIAAYYVLRHLYEPLIRKIFGSKWSYAVCEVCRWFDPDTTWPEPIQMTPDPALITVNGCGVFILGRGL